MTRRHGSSLAWLALGLCGLATPAWADDPKFVYNAQEDTKGKVIWKAAVQAGLVLNTGNANSFAFTAGGSASMLDGWNRLQLDVGGSYARSTVIGADVPGGGTVIDNESEITHTSTTSAELWTIKLRYDRFLSKNNSIYVTGFASGNRPAGIEVAGGGQVGYSRQLLKTDMHLLVAELGYDFTFQDNVGEATTNLDIHSLRMFAGYTITLSKEVGILTGIEILGNLNSLPSYTAGSTIGAFGNTRVNANAALNARIWKNIAFQLSFLARYTNNPAPLPALAGFTFGEGFVPRAQRLDTVTSLSLVITLL
jgi:putative salt-induced outer membrane protein YdiY